MSTSNQTDPGRDAEDWAPCQPGILASYKFDPSLNCVSRRTVLFQMVTIYGSGAFVAAASLAALWRNRAANLGLPPALTCQQVRGKLCQYAEHKIDSQELRASIAQHLVQCTVCDRLFQKLAGNDDDLCSSRDKTPKDPKNCCEKPRSTCRASESEKKAIPAP